MNTVEKIVKHPSVSRVYANDCKIELLTENPALQILCLLRRMRRNAKREIQNIKEDMTVAGFTTGNPRPMPSDATELRLLERAYEHQDLLPADLSSLIHDAIGQKR